MEIDHYQSVGFSLFSDFSSSQDATNDAIKETKVQ
jgi:hypothetical protein